MVSLRNCFPVLELLKEDIDQITPYMCSKKVTMIILGLDKKFIGVRLES